MPGCDGAGMAERSYPVSKVRGGGQEETPCVRSQGRRPRGATLRPRSGAAGRSHLAPEAGGGTLRSYPEPKARGGSWKEPPTPEARARSQEEQPRSSTVQAQEGLEELSHVEDQEQWW